MNELIEKIEELELAAGQLRQRWDDLEREYSSDGIDGEERAHLNAVLTKIETAEAIARDLRNTMADNLSEWESYKSNFDELCHRIRTLSDWGHPEAETLYQETLKIDGFLQEQRWKKATDLFLAIEPNAAPVFAEYQQKSETKKLYLRELKEVEQRINVISNTEYNSVKVSNIANQLNISMVGVMTDAEGLKFDSARNNLADMKLDIALAEKEIETLRSKHVTYTHAFDAIEPDLNDAKKLDDPEIATILEEIAEDVILMEKEASEFEYEAAMKILKILAVDLQSVNHYAKIIDENAKKELLFLKSLEHEINLLESWDFGTRPPELDEFKNKLALFKDLLLVQKKYAHLDKPHQELDEAARKLRSIEASESTRRYVLENAEKAYWEAGIYTKTKMLEMEGFQNKLLAAVKGLEDNIRAENYSEARGHMDVILARFGLIYKNFGDFHEAENRWIEFEHEDKDLAAELKEAFDPKRTRTAKMGIIEKQIKEVITRKDAEATKGDRTKALEFVNQAKDLLEQYYAENGEQTKLMEFKLNHIIQTEADISLNSVKIAVNAASAKFEKEALKHLGKLKSRHNSGGGQGFIDGVAGSFAAVLTLIDASNPITRGVGFGYTLIKQVLATNIDTRSDALASQHIQTVVFNHAAYLQKYVAKYGAGYGKRLMENNRKDWDIMAEFLAYEEKGPAAAGNANVSAHLYSIGLPPRHSGLEGKLFKTAFKAFLEWHMTIVGFDQGHQKRIDSAVEDASAVYDVNK